MEMLRIDELIENRGVYYDDQAVEGLSVIAKTNSL